ncbi:MAG: glycosyltransferase [Desulfovibrionaceae bacterium]|nr:glycosyltransferase [Desulfovibrionaceae bacterium]
MRLAFVIATHGWGGVKTWYLQFAEGMRKRGHAIRVYGSQPEFIEQAKKRTGHGKILRFGPDFGPSILFFIKEFLQFHPDAVIVNIGKDLTTAGVAARFLGIPVIQRIGLPNDIEPKLQNKLLHSWIQPHFLCPCRFIADGFLNALPYIKPERVCVILNGRIPMDHKIEAHRPRRLICTQQLTPDKGHTTLFQALSGIMDLPWELHIYGRGRYEQSLRSLSSDLGISSRVIWHGFTTDIPFVLKNMDIFLLGSLSEGLPNTLLEAMSAGLLPIVRDVGGISEILPPAFRQWLLPYQAGDDTFRSSIREALSLQDEQLTTWKNQAREACKERFCLNRQIEQLEQWLLKICGAKA